MKFTREDITAYFCGGTIEGINDKQREILDAYEKEWDAVSCDPEGQTMEQEIKTDIIEDMCFMALCPAVFIEYRDKFGIGSEIGFSSEDEAISYAKAEWNRLSEADKKSYLEDANGNFTVYDRIEAVEIWSPLY